MQQPPFGEIGNNYTRTGEKKQGEHCLAGKKRPPGGTSSAAPLGFAGAKSLPPSGGRWHPASHGSRMTDEGGVSIPDSLIQRSACRNAPLIRLAALGTFPPRGEGSVGALASWPHRRFVVLLLPNGHL